MPELASLPLLSAEDQARIQAEVSAIAVLEGQIATKQFELQ
jgi:hypothetical protein